MNFVYSVREQSLHLVQFCQQHLKSVDKVGRCRPQKCPFYVFGIRPCHPHLRFNLKLTKAKTEDRLFLSNKSLTDYVTDCRQNVSLIFWDPNFN